MSPIISMLIAAIIVAPITWKIAVAHHKKSYESKIGSAEEKSREIIDEALKVAETKKKEALLEAKEENLKAKNELEKETRERRAEIQRYERRVLSKEENLDKKSEAMERKESSLAAKEETLRKRSSEVEELFAKEQEELEKISGLTSEQAKEYLLGAVAKWTRMGIDGWRLDVATEVDSHFWREFRETIRGINPDALIIGEFWRNSEAWLQGDQYDGVMNYGVQRAAVEYFAKSAVAPQRFQEILTENLMRYSDAANDSMLNLLDSHDTARFLTVSGGNTARLKNAAAFLFTFVGMPCTYYGTEIGMTGENDPDCRKAFDWEESHWNTDLRTHYQKLMRLRKTRKALQEGTVRFRSQGDLFVMERQLQEELLVTVINNTDCPQNYTLSGNYVRDLLSEKAFEGAQNATVVEIPPFSAMILEKIN